MVVVAGVATVHRFKNVRKTFLRELLPRNLLLTLAAIARTVLNFPQSFRRAYRLVDAEQTFPSCSSNRSSPTVTVDYSSFSFLEILRKVESGPFIIFRPSFVFGRKSLENSELFEKFSPQRAEHPISKYEYISGFSFLIYIFPDIRIFSSSSIHGRSTIYFATTSPFATSSQMRSRSPEPVCRLHWSTSATLSSVTHLATSSGRFNRRDSSPKQSSTSPNSYFSLVYARHTVKDAKSLEESFPYVRTSGENRGETGRSGESQGRSNVVSSLKNWFQKLATLLHAARSILCQWWSRVRPTMKLLSKIILAFSRGKLDVQLNPIGWSYREPDIDAIL